MESIAADWRTAPLTAVDRALCTHAIKLTRHQTAVTPADLDILRAQGLDDVAIHDATQVIAFFNYITRIANGLGVVPETFVRPWGQGK